MPLSLAGLVADGLISSSKSALRAGKVDNRMQPKSCAGIDLADIIEKFDLVACGRHL